jgi:hypothetical protein
MLHNFEKPGRNFMILAQIYLLICNLASITFPTFPHAAEDIAVVPTALLNFE